MRTRWVRIEVFNSYLVGLGVYTTRSKTSSAVKPAGLSENFLLFAYWFQLRRPNNPKQKVPDNLPRTSF